MCARDCGRKRAAQLVQVTALVDNNNTNKPTHFDPGDRSGSDGFFIKPSAANSPKSLNAARWSNSAFQAIYCFGNISQSIPISFHSVRKIELIHMPEPDFVNKGAGNALFFFTDIWHLKN